MPTQKEFDLGRRKGDVGAAATWVRRTGCDSWNDLLQKSGLRESKRLQSSLCFNGIRQ